jgi:hypothetical protein
MPSAFSNEFAAVGGPTRATMSASGVNGSSGPTQWPVFVVLSKTRPYRLPVIRSLAWSGTNLKRY